MVKLPSFGDLKKIGSDLLDATKAINVKEVVDHFKSGGGEQREDTTKQLFQRIHSTLQELIKAQPNQDNLIKQLEMLVSELEKIMRKDQKSSSVTQTKPEDKK